MDKVTSFFIVYDNKVEQIQPFMSCPNKPEDKVQDQLCLNLDSFLPFNWKEILFFHQNIDLYTSVDIICM